MKTNNMETISNSHGDQVREDFLCLTIILVMVSQTVFWNSLWYPFSTTLWRLIYVIVTLVFRMTLLVFLFSSHRSFLFSML